MDNEAPNYAEWMPAAGGYVANGNVVSKSPVYDEAGKLKLQVDTSLFGTPQPQTSASPNTQVANTQQTNVGITTANTSGSNVDVNAGVTAAGSMAALSENTAQTGSAISSPATKSYIAEEPILSPEDQILKEIQDATARNDIQAQINGYEKLGQLQNVDYSAIINDLTKQRQDKITNIDDQYLGKLNDAKQKVERAKSALSLASTPEEIAKAQEEYNKAVDEYQALINEQSTWRDTVGYEDAMKEKYQAEIEEVKLDYQSSLMESINAISQQMVQMYQNIVNFQYDPMSDSNLQIAQGYAVSRVKEQMNSTGMFYSTMTQSAIAKAVAELVPVYQKMAREEMIENFNLLQTTASFLMNLEQFQYEMWRDQIELQWEANEQKRKEFEFAYESANARGYYTNDEARIVGVAPGTESYEAKQRALDKQEEIEKEARYIQQQKILGEFNSSLKLQEYEKEQEIATRYALEQYEKKAAIDWEYTQKEYNKYGKFASSGGGGGSGGGNPSSSTKPSDGIQWKGSYDATKLDEYYNDLVDNAGKTPEEALAAVMPEAKSKSEFNRFLAKEGEDPVAFWDWYDEANGYTPQEAGEETEDVYTIPDDLTSIRAKDGTYAKEDIKDFIVNKMSTLPQGQQAVAMNELFNNGFLKQLDTDLADIDNDNDKNGSTKVNAALQDIKNFKNWLEHTDFTEEAKRGYVDSAYDHLIAEIGKVDNKSDSWVEKEQNIVKTTAGRKVEEKNNTQTKVTASPTVLGDKEYIDKNAYKKVSGNAITTKVYYIKKDEGKADSPENFIPVSKDSNGNYYYYSETNAQDGQLKKRIVDSDSVKSKNGGTYQFVMLTPKGNYDYSNKWDTFSNENLAYMRLVEKDPETGRYYYVKY